MKYFVSIKTLKKDIMDRPWIGNWIGKKWIWKLDEKMKLVLLNVDGMI